MPSRQCSVAGTSDSGPGFANLPGATPSAEEAMMIDMQRIGNSPPRARRASQAWRLTQRRRDGTTPELLLLAC